MRSREKRDERGENGVAKLVSRYTKKGRTIKVSHNDILLPSNEKQSTKKSL